MTRLQTLLLLLLALASPAAAAVQEIEATVDEALLPETGTSRRVALLDQLLLTDAGAAAVAQRGLDPASDSAVVAAVVDALFRAGKAVAHLDRVLLLLVDGGDPLRTKVRRQFQIAAEDRARAQELLAALSERARGVTAQASANPRLRLGAVRALAEIPERAAVEVLVEVWAAAAAGGEPTAELAEACHVALGPVVPAETPREAAEYLAQRAWFTYLDLIRRRIDDLAGKVGQLRRWEMEFLRVAPPRRVFEALGTMDDAGREAAARRLKEIAIEGNFTDPPAPEFAKLAWEAFTAELKNVTRNPEVVMRLAESLVPLARGWNQSPLASVVQPSDVVAVLEPLSRHGGEQEPLGLACVRVLEEVGPNATASLLAFARSSRSAAVRMAAVRSLETLARQGKESAAVIGAGLAGLLIEERDPKVRKQMLFSLGQSPVPQALEPIRMLLLPADGTRVELTTVELRDCIVILGRIGTPEALQTLFEVASGHPDVEVRRIAVADGLLERALQGNGAEQEVLRFLGAFVRDTAQSEALRRQTIEELGRKGTRGAHPLLRDLAADESLGALGGVAREAKLQLAERLVAPANNGAARPEDLTVATQILGEELDTVDPARGEAMARLILKATDERKVPAGNARALLAAVMLRRGDVPQIELLTLHRQAASAARADGMDAVQETRLLKARRKLLLEGEPSEELLRRAIETGRRLAELAGEDRVRATGHLLDAAELAIQRLKDRVLGESLLAEAEKPGPPEGAQAARVADLRAALQALQAPAPPPATE